jgi:hypothetical protein
MKEMTDRELLEAVDRAMREVAEMFRAKRKPQARQQAQPPVDPARSAA